jgi:hypothetical protein
MTFAFNGFRFTLCLYALIALVKGQMTNRNKDLKTAKFQGEPEDTEIDVGVLLELAEHIYTQPFSFYRENVSNALDEYEIKDPVTGTPIFEDKEKIVRIEISRLRRRIKFIDFANGIKEGTLRDFKKVGTADTEGVSGKNVGAEVSSYRNIHEMIQGHKHMGKLASVGASETRDVWYYSNNGLNGKILHYKDFKWLEQLDRDTTVAKPEKGLIVDIKDVKAELTNFKLAEKWVSQWFGLRIARKHCKLILVNADTGEEVIITKGDIETDQQEKIDDIKGVPILADIRIADSPKYLNLAHYCKGIWIKSTHIDYKCQGFVDYKDLQVNAGREGFNESASTSFAEYNSIIDSYCEDNFERQGSEPKKKVEHRKLKEDICATGFQVFAELYPQLAESLNGIPMTSGIQGIGRSIEEQGADKEHTEIIPDVAVIEGSPDKDTWVHGEKERKDTDTKDPISSELGKQGKTIEDNGPYTATTKNKTVNNQPTNVRPNIVWTEAPRPGKRGTMVERAEGRIRVVANTLHAAIREALNVKKDGMKSVFSSLVARAIVEHASEIKTDMTVSEYSEMYDNIIDAMLDKPVKE